MTRPPTYRRWAASLPTPEQELLLRAALLNGEPAYNAWAEWKTRADLNNLDAGSHRLLPLLYKNLTEQKIEDDLTDRLKGIYRKTWYKNQLLFHHATEVLGLFERAGIESLVCKGVPLALKYYGDIGLRPMSDVDVLIEKDRVRAAAGILKDAGWVQDPSTRSLKLEYLIEVGNECCFYHPSHQSELDLHWSLYPDPPSADFNKEIWHRRSPFQWGDIRIAIMDPTDEFLFGCFHGSRANVISPIRWIADAHMIARSSGSQIDWDRVLRIAREERFVLAFKNTLTYLHANSIAPIPDGVLHAIQRTPAKFADRLEYWCRNRKPSFLVVFLNRWFFYSRMNRSAPLVYRLAMFPGHIRARWGARNWWQFLRWGAGKMRRRVWIRQQ